MRIVTFILFLVLAAVGLAQNFTYSGYVYNAAGVGVSGVPVNVYKRTTPALSGFTSQTNYNGHSYYRSTTSTTWTSAKSQCEAMNGHLATISNSAENSFLFNTWPSGWFGYYQDKSGAFYSEPLGGWRWTDNYVEAGQVANYDVLNYTSGTALTDSRSGLNAALYNSPTVTAGGGKYLNFTGSQYGITSNLASKFGSSEVVTIMMWIYPTGNGVVLSELAVQNSNSGWHESVIEITGSNTLRVGFWNGTGITQLSTAISLNTWNLVGITYDGSTMTGFKNGVSFGTVTFNREAAHNNGGGEHFAFGLNDFTNMGHGGFGNYRMGNLQVYNTSLTADEMNRCYMSSSWRFGVAPYSNWNPGEPNNAGGEDYAQFVSSGLWNDLPDYFTLPYVIEFDYVVNYTAWVLETTVYTDATGRYTISQPTNPSVERYIEFAGIPVPTFTTQDARSPLPYVLGSQALDARRWYLYDANNDGRINVTDSYVLHGVVSGRFSGLPAGVPKYRLLTVAEYNAVSARITDSRSLYPGVQTITVTSPTSGGATNVYLFRTGYAN